MPDRITKLHCNINLKRSSINSIRFGYNELHILIRNAHQGNKKPTTSPATSHCVYSQFFTLLWVHPSIRRYMPLCFHNTRNNITCCTVAHVSLNYHIGHLFFSFTITEQLKSQIFYKILIFTNERLFINIFSLYFLHTRFSMQI